MSNSAEVKVLNNEQLARFVLFKRWVRQAGTIKPDAFIPPPDLNLSVTRHAALSHEQLWARGRSVAELRGKPLNGRADVSVNSVRRTKLDAIRHPVDGNPEHAHIVEWPTDKPMQKSMAQQLAALAQYMPVDDSHTNST